MVEPLLRIQELVTSFDTASGVVRAVDRLSLEIQPGETVGLVGESGSGKTVTALSILRLVQEPGRIESGQILFQGRDLLALSERDIRAVRGKQIAMVFQEPMTSLNPVFSVGSQIDEVIRLHQGANRRDARRQSVRMLERVGIPEAQKRAGEYPHQLSGGMKQRVMLAMALSCSPALLIADEPTTALDVTIQAQILDLMKDLQHELGMSVLLITHDLGVVAEAADRVEVMYAARSAESAPVAALFSRPAHPYSRGLLRSLPDLGSRRERLYAIPGSVLDLTRIPPGCRFADRCSHTVTRCREEEPLLREIASGHRSACHLAEEVSAAPLHVESDS